MTLNLNFMQGLGVILSCKYSSDKPYDQDHPTKAR
jgi:hypothetical protein